MRITASATRVVAAALGLAALASLGSLLFRSAPSSAFNCPAPLLTARYGDCGYFPDDQDILRVAAHSSSSVVVRWPTLPYRGPFPYPWRIINNGSEDIAVFVRSEEEFLSFLARVRTDPTLSACEVQDHSWVAIGGFNHCTDRYGRNPYPCPTTACGIHFLHAATYCPLEVVTSCGGTQTCSPLGHLHIRSVIIANPPC